MRRDEQFRQLQILDSCGADTVERFWQSGKMMTLPKGQLCIRAREETPNIFFILEGKVQIYNLTGCGKKKILFVLGRGHIANESLLERSGSVFCETMEPCLLYALRQRVLLELMEKDFQLTKELLYYQEKKIWRLEHQLKNTVGSIYLERKLAAKLLKLARDFGVPTEQGRMIDVELSITFLSDFLGVPRETTSRVCRKLTDYGLIIMNKKKICLPDTERMISFYKTGVLPDKLSS